MLPASSTPLATVSPSLLSRLACPARVAFGQGGGGFREPQGSPAIVGTIVHRALELSINGSQPEASWDTAIQEARSRGGDPESIAALRKARLRFDRRVQEVLAFVDGVPAEDRHTEERLVSDDGVLEGTPDLVTVTNGRCDVVDFKTGLVTDVGDSVPRAAYVQQIQMYAHLAGLRYNATPVRGVLLSLKEGAVEVDVLPSSLERAAFVAREQRDAFNTRVPGSQPAKPGEMTCVWCDYQARCDGYWQAVGETQPVGIGRSIKGRIDSLPEVSRNGLTAIELTVQIGAEPGTKAIVAEIPGDVTNVWCAGDVVGFTRLTEVAPEERVFRFGARSLTDRVPAHL